MIRCDRAWSALIFHSWQKKERNGNQNPHPEEKQNAEQSVRNPFPEEEKKEADPEQWEADNTQVEHSLMHICK